jgi:hypothetical protein
MLTHIIDILKLQKEEIAIKIMQITTMIDLKDILYRFSPILEMQQVL